MVSQIYVDLRNKAIFSIIFWTIFKQILPG